MFEVWGQKRKDKWRYEEGNLKPMEFATRAEAETFAGIEGTQMEGQDVEFTVVDKEAKENVCKVVNEAIKDEQEGYELYQKMHKPVMQYVALNTSETNAQAILRDIDDIRSDEAKHEDKLKEIKKKLDCGR